jgi:hypothetical protein
VRKRTLRNYAPGVDGLRLTLSTVDCPPSPRHVPGNLWKSRFAARHYPEDWIPANNMRG